MIFQHRLLILVSLPVFAFAAEPPRVVTLDEAYKAAQEKTETVAIEKTRLNEADARVDQVKGRFLPTLSVGATGQQVGAPNATTAEIRATKATLTQSIFAGGRDTADDKAASQERLAQEKNVAASRDSLFTEVSDSFYGVMAAEKDAANIKRTIDLTLDRVKELRKRREIGKSRNIDVLAAQAQGAVLQADLAAAQRAIAAARNRFALVTGLDRDSRLEEPVLNSVVPDSLETYLKWIEQRPDVQALKAKVEAAQSNIRSAKADHWPSLDLGANYYFDRSGAATTGQGWDATLTLTLPLFQGGITQARVREQSEKEVESELLLRQLRRRAETDIREAHNRVTSAREQITALEKALTITEQNYHEQEKDYRFSLATNLDVLNALNTFQDTKRSLDRTRFEALTAWATLKAATAQVSR